MNQIINKSDLRVVKTAKIINEALFSLLKRQTFKKLTVRDICEEAQISRATFYARFADKYDFLKNWLPNLIPDGLDVNNTYFDNNEIHNDNLYKNQSVIRNLLIDSDSETLDILAEFVLINFLPAKKFDFSQSNTEQVVFSNFFAGGMVFYILWHVKNNFPQDVPPMNKYIFEIVKRFREWEFDTQ